jgi:hypothetical protein
MYEIRNPWNGAFEGRLVSSSLAVEFASLGWLVQDLSLIGYREPERLSTREQSRRDRRSIRRGWYVAGPRKVRAS